MAITINPMGIIVSPGYQPSSAPSDPGHWISHPEINQPKNAIASPTHASHMRRQTGPEGTAQAALAAGRGYTNLRNLEETSGRFTTAIAATAYKRPSTTLWRKG